MRKNSYILRKKRKIKESSELRTRTSFAGWICFAVIAAWCLIIIIALLWAISTAFKGRFDFRDNPVWLPKEWTWNFGKAFEAMYIPISSANGPPRNVYGVEQLANSLIYTIIGLVSSTVALFIMSYITARYKFVGNNLIFTLNLLIMLVPIFGTLPAEIRMVRRLGLYDSFFGIFIMKFSFTGGNYLILRTIIKSVPGDFFDAARIDGAGHFAQMIHIGLPMCLSTVIALMILMFIGYWNEYYTALVYLPTHPVLAYGLFQLQFSTRPEATVPVIMAAAVMLSVPMVIVFIIFRNKIMGNIRMGGLKG